MESVVIGERERARKNFREIAAVIGWADRRLVRHRGRRNEVAPSNLRAVDAELIGRAVCKPLEHVTGLGPARAAKRIGRGGVREQAGHFHEDRRRTVTARQQRAVDRARNGRAECGDIGAEIGQGIDLEREETTVAIERELSMRQVIAPLIVGNKTFRPARDPAHGTAQPSRGPGDDPLLRIELALVAEAAAHVGRNHPQRAFGNAQLLRHLPPDVVRGLCRRIKREFLGLRLAHDRARLDCRAGQAVVDEIERDHMRGGAECRAHGRLIASRPAEAHVAGCAGMQLRRSRCARRVRIGDGDERLVLNLHAFGRVERLGKAFRHDRRDRLADVADLIARQRKARRLGHG